MKGLYLLSLVCWAAVFAIFMVGLFVRIPAVGNALVLLMFVGLASRSAYYWIALNSHGSGSRSRRAAMMNGILSAVVTIAFFFFVVVHQFTHPA